MIKLKRGHYYTSLNIMGVEVYSHAQSIRTLKVGFGWELVMVGLRARFRKAES